MYNTLLARYRVLAILGLKRLKRLSLRRCELKALPEWIARCGALEELFVAENAIVSPMPSLDAEGAKLVARARALGRRRARRLCSSGGRRPAREDELGF